MQEEAQHPFFRQNRQSAAFACVPMRTFVYLLRPGLRQLLPHIQHAVRNDRFLSHLQRAVGEVPIAITLVVVRQRPRISCVSVVAFRHQRFEKPRLDVFLGDVKERMEGC